MKNRHLESLMLHGARIFNENGERLTEAFAERAINKCRQWGCNAIAYILYLPEPDITEPLAICFWRDGRIDSGSVENIKRLLDF